MTSRTRLWVLAISTPILIFAVLGGYFGQVLAKDEQYPHLKVFDDVVSLVVNNYVEEVDVKKAMGGAMRGLADGLDPDTAYVSADLVKAIETNQPLGPGDVGVEISRQYYLRVISVRDGSPAAKAGIRVGDFVRAIDGKATRDMSAFEGTRLLHGAQGSKVTLLIIRGNAADPHEIVLTRDRAAAADVTSRMAESGTGYIRLTEFGKDTPARLKQVTDSLTKSGATRFIIDLRGAARGEVDEGIAAARLFVKSGTLAVKQTKGAKETITAQSGDGAVAARVLLLVNPGTSGAAEVFAAALEGNGRAELIGEHTLGRAAKQSLVKLPDGSGLLLTNLRYLTPAGKEIHEKGLEPKVAVDEPDVEFGAEPPTTDPIMEKALQLLTEKKAA